MLGLNASQASVTAGLVSLPTSVPLPVVTPTGIHDTPLLLPSPYFSLPDYLKHFFLQLVSPAQDPHQARRGCLVSFLSSGTVPCCWTQGGTRSPAPWRGSRSGSDGSLP